MIINGKERGLLLTVGASVEISDMCPQGDLSRLGEVFDQAYGKQVRATVKMIAAMSRAYEDAKHFEDPSYEPDALTVNEILSLEPSAFRDLTNEAMKKFIADQTPTVEVEESKKKGSAT